MSYQLSPARGACRTGRPGPLLCRTLLSAFLLASPTVVERLCAGVVINEIHYAPDVKTEPVEFVELFNPDAAAVDLGGWTVTGGIDFTVPSGTTIAPGGYLVLAQDPDALRKKFGVAGALGPWRGKLSNQGDRIVLRNASGEAMNEVDYKLGFPWPTVGAAPGYSIELINPALDNTLGGSWRASVQGEAAVQAGTLIPDHASWRYVKGTAEPSSPTTAWREPAFDDSGWLTGGAPVGYGENFIATSLPDMRDHYTSVFFRSKFVVADPAQLSDLLLEAQYDDGIKVWINGVNLINANIASGEVPYDGTANSAIENADYVPFALSDPARYLVPGTNTIAVQAHNSSLSSSTDFFFDLRLTANAGPKTHGPTPGARNSVYADAAPPQVRQVTSTPDQPVNGQPVKVTAKVTSPNGVGSVVLQYQLVNPGEYIAIDDAAYQSDWTSLAMNDQGTGADLTAGDSIYSVEMPGALQVHRRLVRFRITAMDARGRSVTAPYPDDPQPNFAYFVYDGVPAWRGALEPKSSDPARSTPVLYDTNVMRRLPVYHLISKKDSVERATWRDRYGGDLYKWKGTLVYEGQVYDHIGFRARGGVWRYAMGKNMWKFDFNRGHDFKPKDDYGRAYGTPWTKLNLGACIQQADYLHRGEQGMYESVGLRLFNLTGVAAPRTHFIQFRVIDQAEESNSTNQYAGDFWGLYLAVEQEDGRFLDEHDLPDGNFYKMEGGTGELNNQGASAVTDKSDLNAFMSAYRSGTASEDWWRTHFRLDQYYSYQAIVQAIHHYDICYGKNYFYFLDPSTGLWSVHPWDLDLTWANNMFDAGCGGADEFKDRVLTQPAFRLEFQNRVREIRVLLFNPDQTGQLIDEYAALIDEAPGRPAFVAADRAMWDYNPIMADFSLINPSKAGQGRFYQIAPSKDFHGMLRLMKDYVVERGALLDNLAQDPLIPETPVVSSTAPGGFPVNRLTFRASAYSGANAFAAMQWRVGEVTPASQAALSPIGPRKYEIEPVWESPELEQFAADITVPGSALKVGHNYRVRARMKDATGRWSHWSDAVEFVAGQPDTASLLRANLRLTELMYDPPGGSEFEFVELHNTSTSLRLDLGGARFTQGIDFTFAPGIVLPPDGYVLLARGTNASDFAGFRAHYGLSPDVPILGPYGGALENSGERITLRSAAGGADLFSFSYEDAGDWPALAAGAGHSLVPVDSAIANEPDGSLVDPRNWRASAAPNGSPGRADPPPGSASDSDGDGMPDDWERAHGLDPALPGDAALDSDGDGMANLQEYRSGTDPGDAGSVLRLQAGLDPGGWPRLSFTGVAGRAYTVSYSDSLQPGSWQALKTLPAASQTQTFEVVDTTASARGGRYYRVETR